MGRIEYNFFKSKNHFLINFFNKDTTGIFIKILTNWQQILMVVPTFFINLPEWIGGSSKQSGNPGS